MLGAVFLAGLLRGFTGFGFALAAVPLASLVLPPSRAVPMVILLQLCLGLRDGIAERRRADRFSVGWVAAGCVLGTPLGVAALAALPQPVVRLVLGVIVGVAVLATWHGPGRPLERRRGLAMLAGLASGVCNGLAAMGGPPVILYFLAVEPVQAVMRSSLLVYFALAAVIALPGTLAAGLIDAPLLAAAAAGVPVVLAGSWIGGWGFRHAGHRCYRMVAAGVLLVTALATIIRGIAGLSG
ncbi:sulfite exporter TauE/SafE family protein [Rhodovastum atsumiense]|uniref:Probable membrane transporter protein n=1 Tax=Rhodovastum atsumiense TaxID=504468 RepID=A0A5M6IJI4_9PROT|nr:sulfite exporter TauE/SafE family protein [Rhodovastum atsumiense]